MRFARVNDDRREAEPRLVGYCPRCGSPLVPKCGDFRVWHWAHRGIRHCDPWWEETEWHLVSKNRFPTAWQEILHRSEKGEKHIADVKTPDGRVVEFQHSPLSVDERRSREAFYAPLIWVVNGLRRKRDKPNFYKALQRISLKPSVYSSDPIECALLRDWLSSTTDVFFDFGSTEEDRAAFGKHVLWHLHPNMQGRVLLTPVSLDTFVSAVHQGLRFKRLRVVARAAPPTPMVLSVLPIPAVPNAYSSQNGWRRGPESFQQYLARKQRQRSRRRF